MSTLKTNRKTTTKRTLNRRFHIPNDNGRWTGTITIDTFGEMIEQTREVQIFIILVEDT